MAAPKINPAVRYSNTINEVVYWVPTMADYTNPTRAELDAGTNITGVIPKDGISGFSGSEQTQTTDDLASGKTLPLHDGEDFSQGSSINAWKSKTGTDIRTVMPKYSSGNLVIFDAGDTAGGTMDVFPAYVGSHQKSRSGPAMVTIGLSYTGVPAENITVPA